MKQVCNDSYILLSLTLIRYKLAKEGYVFKMNDNNVMDGIIARKLKTPWSLLLPRPDIKNSGIPQRFTRH
ncbi:MAG: hypothetical protein M3Z92_01780 [Bacteroidota bacterium]|nr:hypothetical protein [Bacteroidota bacterium]